MPDRPQELRAIDDLLQKYGEEDFVNFVQSPKYQEALHVAVSHLVDSWPTHEQIEELWDHYRQNGGYKLLEKTLVEHLRNARTLDGLDAYNPETTTHEADAKLFWKLHQRRPINNQTFIPFDPIKNAVYSIAKGS